MGAVLQASERVLLALKLFGGAYLLWLAYAAARSAARPAPRMAAPVGHGRWVLRGVILNLSNPKAVFAWMAALAVGLNPSDGAAAVVAATVICAGIGLANYALWAVLFSTHGAMALYARMRRGIDGALALLFGVAGLGLIRSALAR